MNPPPEPPNCPPLPELANLRLKDGRIADVRIFRDGNTTFYIPFSWFEWEAKQGGSFAGIEETGPAGYWKMWSHIGEPNVHEVECPGVVHVGAFSYATPMTSTKFVNTLRDQPPNFSREGEMMSVSFIHIFPERVYNPKTRMGFLLLDQNLELNVGTADGSVRVSKTHLAEFKGFPYDDEYKNSPRVGAGRIWDSYKVRTFASPRWRVWRRSVHEVFDWLTTPPKDRGNDREFKLGAED